MTTPSPRIPAESMPTEAPDVALAEFAPSPAYANTRPASPRPIVLIGAGGIVRDAHLPAYAKAGFPVASLTDRDFARAESLAAEFGIPAVHTGVAEAVSAAPHDAVFDVAVPPAHIYEVLEALPRGAAVLLQKPLGENTVDTDRILRLCREKELVAAVNMQLRFAPYIAAARRAIAQGLIGELYDLEVVVEVNTPWELFPYVLPMERLELHMHSIHYIDLVRSFVGDPASVSCSTVRRPGKAYANSRSAILFHYPDRALRALVNTNHEHRFGPAHEQSFIKWEGTDGAIRAQLGLLLDYPRGREDALEIYRDADPDAGWQPLPFSGTWFPDAFIGSMGVLQRFVEGSADALPTSVDNVQHTMAVIEAAYESHTLGGVIPAYAPASVQRRARSS